MTGLKIAGDDEPGRQDPHSAEQVRGRQEQQIAEYLEVYRGEGIQHVALSTPGTSTRPSRRSEHKAFPLPKLPPATYYEMLDERLPNHGEDVERSAEARHSCRRLAGRHGGRLLQIFTTTLIGPIFFEIIQRKGDEGFGEGNFQALFESMERDQIRRGVLR